MYVDHMITPLKARLYTMQLHAAVSTPPFRDPVRLRGLNRPQSAPTHPTSPSKAPTTVPCGFARGSCQPFTTLPAADLVLSAPAIDREEEHAAE